MKGPDMTQKMKLASPTEDQVFEAWLTVRSEDSRDPLSPEAAKPYRYIWLSWCQWLRSKSLPEFHRATAEHVLSFLDQGPSPASGRVSKSAPISPITRRRYWMVLKDVYEFACAREWVTSNPFKSMSESDRPASEKSEGIVLTPQHFAAIYKVLPNGHSMWDIRDRAILLLLLEAALTPGEIALLQCAEVFQDTANPGCLGLSLNGKRKSQEREIPLSMLASQALEAWLKLRPVHESKLVFLTQSLLPMSRRPLFHLVSKTIIAGAKESGLPSPGHLGPQVLRNSRLILWIKEGRPIAEVATMAGYKDARSFRGLRRHLPSTVHLPVDRK